MRKIRHSFNMVEIVLAIGVVAFGITGVMALLPPALNANRDVVNDSFVDEAISTMQAAFSTYCIPRWDTFIDSSLFIKDVATSDIEQTNKALNTTYAPAEIKGKNPFPDASVSSLFNISRVNNVYYIESIDGTTAIHATIWKEQVRDMNCGKTSYTYLPQNANAQRIYMTFSWPTTAAWSARQTRTIVFDVFKGM